MEKIYDFSYVIDAVRNDENPYHILGISSDTPDEVIIKMWNKYKDRNITSKVRRAFEMLVVPVNRWVYDRMMKYVSKKGKADVFAYALDIECELRDYIADRKRDIIRHTKDDFEKMLAFGIRRLTMDDPSTGSKMIEHVARYTKNEEGFWFYSKDLNIYNTQGVVDIYKRGDKYVYFIREHNWEYIIESRYLFIDFNKPTRFDGSFCSISDVACRIKENLLGHYTEINNMDRNILTKYDYFKNKLGNSYKDIAGRVDAVLKIVNIRDRQISVPRKFNIVREEDFSDICCSLMNYDEYFLKGNEITESEEELFLTDVKNTNPDDVIELKKIVGRRLI